MRVNEVKDIVLCFKEGVPLQPSVTMNDKITHAIELMVNNNLDHIAVIQNKRLVGMIRLEDAFKKLGIQSPLKKY